MIRRIHIYIITSIWCLGVGSAQAQSIDSTVTEVEYTFTFKGKMQEIVNKHLQSASPASPKMVESIWMPLDFYQVHNPVIDSLMAWNMVHLPIYTYKTVEDHVVSFTYYEYDVTTSKPLLKKRYGMVAQQPKPLNQFGRPIVHSSGITLNLNDYELLEEYELYDERGNALQIRGRDDKVVSHLYDHDDRLIASVSNAENSDVAYYYHTNSLVPQYNFTDIPDSTQYGNWSVGDTNTLIKTGLDTSKTYVLSLWVSNSGGGINISGANILDTIHRETINVMWGMDCNLRYYYLNNASSVTVHYSGFINDVRLYPLEAQMTTYNYDLEKQMRVADVNQIYTHYMFDSKGRNTDVYAHEFVSGNGVVHKFFVQDTVNSIRGEKIYDGMHLSGAAQHYDAAGRLVQSLGKTAGSSFWVDQVDYDDRGLVSKKRDVYATNSWGLDFYPPQTVEEQYTAYFADTTRNTDVNPYPYTVSIYDDTTGELLEQGGSGSYYQPYSDTIAHSGHTTKYQTRRYTQGVNEFPIKYWRYETGNLIPMANYIDPILTVTTTKGPNWTSGKTNTVEIYKDWKGRTLLEKQFLSDTDSAVTYYLYDGFDRLTHVIPPSVPFVTTSESDETFKHYIYAYRYDKYGRMVEKKLPGQGVMSMVYNKSNMLVAVQDSVSRSKSKWIFTKYDAVGRRIKTIQDTFAGSRSQLQAIYDTATYHWEIKPNYATSTYSSRTYPFSGGKELTVLYYDRYGGNLPVACPWRAPDPGELPTATGSPVAVKTNMLGTDDYLWSVSFYDGHSRLGRTVQENVLGGSDISRLTYLNNTQHISSKTNIHYDGTDTLSHLTYYDYDDALNLVRVRHQMEENDPYILRYDHLGISGKVIFSNIGGDEFNPSEYVLQIHPKYDFAGRTRKIEGRYRDDQPAFQIQYGFEDVARNEFRGNITSTGYTIGKDGGDVNHTANYHYDALNRLAYAGNSYGEVADEAFREYFEYDITGNITSVGRYAKVEGITHQVDSLQYSYTGLRHTRIDDISAASAPVKALGFDEKIQTSDEYLYDGNGRAVRDLNKGIQNIRYNMLDLPDTVFFDNGDWVHYRYSAGGSKLSKHAKIGVQVYDAYYVNGIEYRGVNGGAKVLDFIHADGVRIKPNGLSYDYLFDITDSRGNSLATFSHSLASDTVQLIQVNSYYAYGGAVPYTEGNFVSGDKNLYLYNGKELQEETGWYDYDARLYDPVIGRWNVVDPMSESFYGLSPYNYVLNNPINYTDPTGMYPYGPYGKHGAPGLDPDRRLKEIYHEGLTFGIPDWAFRNGNVQDMLFFEEYGQSRIALYESEAQSREWQSSILQQSIGWNPSTYLVRSGLGIENYENGRMIYSYWLAGENRPGREELYQQKANEGIVHKLAVTGAALMNAYAGLQEINLGKAMMLAPTGITQAGGTYNIADGLTRILSAPIQIYGTWTNNKTLENSPHNLLGGVGFLIDNISSTDWQTGGAVQNAMELGGDFGLSRAKLIQILEKGVSDPTTYKTLINIGNAGWQIVRPYKDALQKYK